MASKRKQRIAEPMPVQTPVPPKPAAPPARCASSLSIFRAANIEVQEGREPTESWRIAGRFNFWPLSMRWSEDGSHPMAHLDGLHQGYGAVSLRDLIRQLATAPEALDAVARALDPVSVPEVANV